MENKIVFEIYRLQNAIIAQIPSPRKNTRISVSPVEPPTTMDGQGKYHHRNPTNHNVIHTHTLYLCNYTIEYIM